MKVGLCKERCYWDTIMLARDWHGAYHILAHIKQSFAEVQDLQQALGVGITQAQHCPSKQQVKAGHSCVGNVRQLHQQQVCCLDMPSEVRAEQQLPAEIDIGLSPCTYLLQRQQCPDSSWHGVLVQAQTCVP